VVSFMTAIVSTSDRLHSEFIRFLFLQTHRETDRFLAVSGVQSDQFDRGYFHFRRAAFSSILKSKCGNILPKAEALRINLNLDGVTITSKSHSHPSHSQTSRLLTSSLSLDSIRDERKWAVVRVYLGALLEDSKKNKKGSITIIGRSYSQRQITDTLPKLRRYHDRHIVSILRTASYVFDVEGPKTTFFSTLSTRQSL
jgi:hypothetical protein